MMANTILNLKLEYKGKHLDTIHQNSDFTDKWFIGSDRRMFWQILDDTGNFPNKYKLLVKHGNDFFLQVPDGSNISCSRGGNPVDASFLQQNGILRGSQLQLRNDMSGRVRITPDYEILYEYTEPRKIVLAANEQAVVNQSLLPTPLSTAERTDRGFILLFLILGIAFVLIYDVVLKPKIDQQRTLTELMAELERVRRIEPQLPGVMTPPEAQAQPQEQPEKPKEGTAAKPRQGGTKGRTGTPGRTGVPSTQQVFGNLRPPGVGSSSGQTAVGATVLAGFTTARPGSKGGSGPSGTGPGMGGSFQPSAAAGYSGSFDPTSTQGFNQTSLSAVVSGTTPTGGTTVRPSGPTQSYTGSAERLQPLQGGDFPYVQAPQTERVTQSVKAPEVTKLPETSVSIPKPSSSAQGADNIYNQIRSRKGQIEQSYKRNAAVKKQSGSITVVMDISANGSVTANVMSNSSSFTQSFLNEIKGIVENWRFSVSKPTQYRFKMNLSQA
jgi:outer membrane biosynthesis protein TonB